MKVGKLGLTVGIGALIFSLFSCTKNGIITSEKISKQEIKLQQKTDYDKQNPPTRKEIIVNDFKEYEESKEQIEKLPYKRDINDLEGLIEDVYNNGYTNGELYTFNQNDIKSFKEAFKEHPEHVLAFIIDYWNKAYTGQIERFGKDLKVSLDKAVDKSREYIPWFKNRFIKYGIPEEHSFIFIPESHFISFVIGSKVGAKGIYQIMAGTGRNLGLNIVWSKSKRRYVYDERHNPFLSADAAAKLFSELFSLFRDEGLGICAYNSGMPRNHFTRVQTGGFLKKDLKHKPFGNGSLSLENYFAYFGWLIEERSSKRYTPKLITHRVRKGQNLGSIARMYRTNVSNIKRLNNKGRYRIRGSTIIAGRTYKIKWVKKEVKPIRLSYIRQNTNYPGKHYAVLQLLQELYPDYFNLKPNGDYDIVTLTNQGSKKQWYRYRIRSGDSLKRISKKTGVNIRNLQRFNNMGRRTRIYAGKYLKIPDTKGWISIDQTVKKIVSDYEFESADEFYYFNHHFKTASELPRKYNIVVPKKEIMYSEVHN